MLAQEVIKNLTFNFILSFLLILKIEIKIMQVPFNPSLLYSIPSQIYALEKSLNHRSINLKN